MLLVPITIEPENKIDPEKDSPARRFIEERLKEGKKIENEADDATSPFDKKAILCAFCQAPITDPSQSIVVNGSRQHLFTNPHGLVFEIGCFNICDGAAPASPPSMEFSWFPGYSWRVAVCRRCQHHIGWQFMGEKRQFYGLILDHLITP